jgi:hypothetical protein
MFDSLMLLFIVILGLIWILDFLGVLEIGAIFVTLIAAAIAGVAGLVTYLFRRLSGPAKPQP